jgi:hypothetical protein
MQHPINRIIKSKKERLSFIKKFCERPYKCKSLEVVQPNQSDLLDEMARFQTSLEKQSTNPLQQCLNESLKHQIFG